MEKDQEESQKATDRIALTEAKKLGKEAHAAAKAQLAQERAATSEAKKTEKLRIIVEQKAEKARLAAESKAKQANAKVCMYYINLEPFLTTLFSRHLNRKQHHKSLKGYPKVNSVPSPHPCKSPPQQ